MRMACRFEDCRNDSKSRGLCDGHYTQLRRRGPDNLEPLRPHHTGCAVEGCDRPHSARGWCKPHYKKLHKPARPEHADEDRPIGYDPARADAAERKARALALNDAHWRELIQRVGRAQVEKRDAVHEVLALRQAMARNPERFAKQWRARE